MRVLCTFPGRFGDLLWALPSIRALSRRIGQPLDLRIAGEFASIVPLLQMQPYLGKVRAHLAWSLTPPEEWKAPPSAEDDYDHVFDLGYRGWPSRPLPFEVLDTYNREQRFGYTGMMAEEELDLSTPWITVDPIPDVTVAWACAFTEAHFELKYGLWELLTRALPLRGIGDKGYSWTFRDNMPLGHGPLSLSTGGRWQSDAHHGGTESWIDMARWITSSPLLFTDCSAPHVLGVALGVPVLICEPMEARWNPIFFPLGMDGPQVTVVKGTDGLPTFDARHCGDAIEAALAHLKETTT